MPTPPSPSRDFFASPLRALRGLFLFLLIATTARAAAPPPNIVFILADDLGWRDLACTGSTFYETPNLDRLAKEGTRFTTAYAACPVCSPSRASIMTGMYTPRTGVTDYLGGHSVGKLLPAPYANHLLVDFTTARALKPAGYVSWHVGKWHLGNGDHLPLTYGFDSQVVAKNGTYYPPYKAPAMTDGPAGEYLTDRLATEAINFLNHRDPNKPFFLNLWFTAPHVPLQAPKPLVDKYIKKARDLGLEPDKGVTTDEHFPTVGKAKQFIERRHVQSHPVYAAMIESLDTNIGRVLQTLDDLHLADNTLVIFTSDNGGLSTAEGSPTSNEPLADGKGWLYEGGTRVPLIVRYPGVTKAGTTCDTRVSSIDYLPTLADIAGAPKPQGPVDGLSLLPLLKDPTSSLPDRPLYWHYPHYGNQGGVPGSSVLAGDYKLIQRYETPTVELYNLKDDPSENHDLAKTNPAIAEKLHAQLAAWLKSVDAKLPEPNTEYPNNPNRKTPKSPAPPEP